MGFLSKSGLWQICFPVSQLKKIKFPLGSCLATGFHFTENEDYVLNSFYIL